MNRTPYVARMPGRNSTNVVWINTELHRCTQMEDDTSYHVETLNQGRDATNPVPKCSMYAGKPVEALRPSRRMSPMKRMLAAAIGSWLAFAVLVWGAYVNTHGG